MNTDTMLELLDSIFGSDRVRLCSEFHLQVRVARPVLGRPYRSGPKNLHNIWVDSRGNVKLQLAGCSNVQKFTEYESKLLENKLRLMKSEEQQEQQEQSERNEAQHEPGPAAGTVGWGVYRRQHRADAVRLVKDLDDELLRLRLFVECMLECAPDGMMSGEQIKAYCRHALSGGYTKGMIRKLEELGNTSRQES